MFTAAAPLLARLKLVVPILLIYGLLLYAIIWQPYRGFLPALSGMVLLPMAIGSLSAALLDPQARRPLFDSILLSWGAFAVLFVVLAVLAGEGVICMVMVTPIYLPASALGCWVTRLWVTRQARRNTVSMFAALPLLALPLDAMVAWPDHLGSVTTVIEIAAPAHVIWDHTVEIPDIDASRLPWTFSHGVLQVPQPLDARIEGQGKGAVRHLTWTKGVTFREIITEWDLNRRLVWDFGFDPQSIPPGIDDHIRVDSPYLKLASGEYVLEPLDDQRTRLVLTTRYRVSTPLNSYLKIWSHVFLNDFHSVVLHEIRLRSEQAARG
ncbi:hypothetical protein PE067_21450 [Paracoccus sp. DMF-8]|uniref:SRPBCC family protein n=1 Tax=Paracoccus sp. DMF-8 TaxID=3019445 RepID=UPI0023E3B21A|nr:SRPBCC family protein [Paracoccus sp. DMF-8]MDF3608479.1 hypothetical protein [Paracoccus sp. DMF-8]